MHYTLFKEFDKITRIDLTLKNGVCVAIRKHLGDDAILFHMGSFYVELLFLNDSDEILAVFNSDKEDILIPYLKNIDISDILDQ